MTHYTREAPNKAAALPAALANINNQVLDNGIMKKLFDPDIYYAFEQCRKTGQPMEKNAANALANSIREWAQSKGCIGYSHWFSPMRGAIHGEKLETFMAVDFETSLRKGGGNFAVSVFVLPYLVQPQTSDDCQRRLLLRQKLGEGPGHVVLSYNQLPAYVARPLGRLLDERHICSTGHGEIA